MKKILILLIAPVLLLALQQCALKRGTGDLSVLLVTGGHAYDTSEFLAMFDDMDGIEISTALKPVAWQKLKAGEEFDAMVFYDMYQEISEEEKKIFLAEFEKGTGMIFLHHSLGSHQEWPEYAGLVGGKFYISEYTPDTSLVLGYMHDINLKVKVIDPQHPVTEGVEDYEIIDEGYTNIELKPGLRYLLETDHPECDPYLGWAHVANNSRVVYLMGGHDKFAYQNESFSRLIENAIRWTADEGNR